MMLRKMICVMLMTIPTFTQASMVDTANFKQALKIKKGLYLEKGTFTGGDRLSSDFIISQIRIASNPEGYDRTVIELKGNPAAADTSLKRPPYYQVQLQAEDSSVLVTVYGKPKLEFSSMQTVAQSKKTSSLKGINLLPLVDADRWTFSMATKPGTKVEVFELTDPARIIIDLK